MIMATKQKIEMRNATKTIIAFIKKNVEDDIRKNGNLTIVLDAYNRMQEDEYDGFNYIFDLSKQKDLQYLVEKDMIDAYTIAFVINNPNLYPNRLFTFDGEKNKGMRGIESIECLLLDNLELLIPFVLMYCCRCKEYNDFYERYFVCPFEDMFGGSFK
jgi:hypothetical protein